MKLGLLPHLVCPECKTELRLYRGRTEGDEVETGTLVCGTCSHSFPVENGVPRFVDSDAYADSFSKQRLYVRRHFASYRDNHAAQSLFRKTTGFTAEAMRTGINLEVGCGYGRFVEVVSSWGGQIIGVDLSTHSVDLAYEYVGRRENVHIVQCDLFNLPFRVRWFDRIFSIGVLHHTPDTRAAFDAVVPYVGKGGQMAVWVYPPSQKVASNRWRRFTVDLPEGFLYAGCIANQALFSWIRRLPGGWRFSRLIPGAQPRPDNSFWTRVLSDFDDLSPTYAHVHRPEEVRRWFCSAGLTDVEALGRLTAVRGIKDV